MNPVTRTCPACNDASTPRHLIEHVALEPIIGVTVINSYDVAQCLCCGMIFADRIPDQAAISAYYAKASKYTSVSDSDRKRHQATAEAIRTCLSPRDDARILDVGAGAEGLAAALAPLHVVSTDTLDHIPGLMASLADPFDGVILSGVLEHVADVQHLLRRIRNLLLPDGWLWIEVPDAGGWPIHGEYSAPFQEFSSEHVNYFTDATLVIALFLAGFQVRACRSGSVHQTPTQSAAHLTMWARPRRVDEARAPVERYLADSTERFQRYVDAAHALPNPCILWGVGTLTRRLWPHLKDKAVLATDHNPAYHGHMIDDICIVAPAEAVRVAADKNIPIIACTQGAAQAIQSHAASLGASATALLDFAHPSAS
jgi:SAM-dependent methyltransferase